MKIKTALYSLLATVALSATAFAQHELRMEFDGDAIHVYDLSLIHI